MEALATHAGFVKGGIAKHPEKTTYSWDKHQQKRSPYHIKRQVI